jgi:hypothetical protein
VLKIEHRQQLEEGKEKKEKAVKKLLPEGSADRS